jgi:FkbM family methyltransferase
LEEAGRRAELAHDATVLLREALARDDIEVLWDGMWIRRVGSLYFPDPELFAKEAPPFPRWGSLDQKFLRDADDYWFHVYKPKAGDVIVDVGAGRGEDVFAFSRAVGETGHVLAIEPHPVSFATLTKFVAMNGFSNVTTLRRACLDRVADLQIETLPVWESNYVREGEPTSSSYPVHGMTLDSICNEQSVARVDFLKMNIEGAERFALPGAIETLQRTLHVCIAAHDFRANRGEGEAFRTLGFVREVLTRAGFELRTRDEDPRYYVPYHVHGVRRGESHGE